MNKHTGGFAYPTHFEGVAPIDHGMTLRDYFAATCPIKWGEAQDYNTGGADEMDFFIAIRLQYADKMIAERAK